MTLIFPQPQRQVTVATPTIKEAIRRVMSVHQARGQMVVMTGKSGAGKTTAALHIEHMVNEAHAAKAENSFAAKHYVASDMLRSCGGVLQRRVLSEFAKNVLHLTVPRDVRTIDVTSLLSLIASGLRRMAIQLVFIDEAGHIPPAGLDHLATLINIVSTKENHPLTVALVGMHELPYNVRQLPQVERRVAEFILFAPYDAPTARLVLASIHPYFDTLDVESPEGKELMEWLLCKEVSDGGLVGLMVPLVERAAAHAQTLGLAFGLKALRLAYTLKREDVERGRAEMDRKWAGAR